MSATDLQQIVIGVLEGLASSTVFILALFIGFLVGTVILGYIAFILSWK